MVIYSLADMHLSDQKDQCNAMNPAFEDLRLKLQRVGNCYQVNNYILLYLISEREIKTYQ